MYYLRGYLMGKYKQDEGSRWTRNFVPPPSDYPKQFFSTSIKIKHFDYPIWSQLKKQRYCKYEIFEVIYYLCFENTDRDSFSGVEILKVNDSHKSLFCFYIAVNSIIYACESTESLSVWKGYWIKLLKMEIKLCLRKTKN